MSKARTIEELIEGRFPGVRVIRTPDGSLSVRIRGATGEPLYVLDGMPLVSGPGGGSFGINPADVASIEVLSDAGSTAAWGIRGGNGVILITTKR